jgi:hypothetical protein
MARLQAIVGSDGFVHIVSVPSVEAVRAHTDVREGAQAWEGGGETASASASALEDGPRRIQLVPSWTGFLAPGQKGRPVAVEVRDIRG